MTNAEAVQLLKECKPLAARLSMIVPGIIPAKLALSPDDFRVITGFLQVQHDPIIAGPGLLNRLYKEAELNQVEVAKLELVVRLINRQRYAGRTASLRFDNGTSSI